MSGLSPPSSKVIRKVLRYASDASHINVVRHRLLVRRPGAHGAIGETVLLSHIPLQRDRLPRIETLLARHGDAAEVRPTSSGSIRRVDDAPALLAEPLTHRAHRRHALIMHGPPMNGIP